MLLLCLRPKDDLGEQWGAASREFLGPPVIALFGFWGFTGSSAQVIGRIDGRQTGKVVLAGSLLISGPLWYYTVYLL